MPPLTIVLRVYCERFPQKTLRDGPPHIRYLLTAEDQDIVEGHDASYLVIPIYYGYASDTMGVHEGSQLCRLLSTGDVDRLWCHDLAQRCALRILVFAGHPQRDVPIGENPRQFALLRCDDAADVVCPRQLAALSNILVGRNRDDRLLVELLR